MVSAFVCIFVWGHLGLWRDVNSFRAEQNVWMYVRTQCFLITQSSPTHSAEHTLCHVTCFKNRYLFRVAKTNFRITFFGPHICLCSIFSTRKCSLDKFVLTNWLCLLDDVAFIWNWKRWSLRISKMSYMHTPRFAKTDLFTLEIHLVNGFR